jgi:hypothetical protein
VQVPLLEPRPLSEAERAVLAWLIERPATRAALGAQLATADVVSVCSCGCGSIGLQVSDDAPRASWSHEGEERDWFQVTAQVEPDDDRTMPGVVLTVAGGTLDELELWDSLTGRGVPVPDPTSLFQDHWDRVHQPTALEDLLTLLDQDLGGGEQLDVARAIVAQHRDAGTDELLRLVDQPKATTRAAAAHGLGAPWCGRRLERIQALRRLLADTRVCVLVAAIDSLRSLQTSSAWDEITALGGHRSPRVREAVLEFRTALHPRTTGSWRVEDRRHLVGKAGVERFDPRRWLASPRFSASEADGA